jgi:hypothetical protein
MERTARSEEAHDECVYGLQTLQLLFIMQIKNAIIQNFFLSIIYGCTLKQRQQRRRAETAAADCNRGGGFSRSSRT